MRKRSFQAGTSSTVIAKALAVYAIVTYGVLYYSQVWSWITGNPDDSLTGLEAAKTTAVVMLVSIALIVLLVLGIAFIIRVTNKVLEKNETDWEE